MKCTKCKQSAVFLNPHYCKQHFIQYVEKKVKATIQKYALLKKKDKVVVGVSGGKDSLTILYLLKKWGYSVIAVCIDEGISTYRSHTIEDMKQCCEKYAISYKIISYKEEFGKTLDEMILLLNEKPCTICGAFRRYLLNKKARELGATKMATGHNMDDEAQAVLMNLFRHQTDILPRLGPATGIQTDVAFVPRIKPLYFVAEKEIAAYAFLMGFGVRYTECPYAVHAYRGKVGDILNAIEQQYPGAKMRLLKKFVARLPVIKKKIKKTAPVQQCNACHEPSVGVYCKTCQLLMELKKR